MFTEWSFLQHVADIASNWLHLQQTFSTEQFGECRVANACRKLQVWLLLYFAVRMILFQRMKDKRQICSSFEIKVWAMMLVLRVPFSVFDRPSIYTFARLGNYNLKATT